MRKWIHPALCSITIGLLALTAAAQRRSKPIGMLEGTVVNAQGKPVADASVTIQTSDGRHPHAARTDANGHFQFARYATGQYDLRAYSNGVFSDWDKRVVIRSKKTTRITLHLAATPK